MKTKTLAVLAFMTLGTNSFAQNQMTAHVGVGVPLGEFAQGTEYFGFIKNESYAGVGISLGCTYQYPLGSNGLYVFGDLSIHRNAIRRRLRNDYKEWANDNMSINHSEYYNIPLTVGAMYQRNVEENLALYVQGGALFNYLKISKTRTTTQEDDGEYGKERRYPIRYAIGASFETGVVINDRLQIGLGVTRHGGFLIEEQSFTFTPDILEESGHGEATKNITMFNLKFGLRF